MSVSQSVTFTVVSDVTLTQNMTRFILKHEQKNNNCKFLLCKYNKECTYSENLLPCLLTVGKYLQQAEINH